METQKFEFSFKTVRNSNFDFWRGAEISVGRGDSSHLVTRGDSSHSPFRGEKTWKSKNGYYHSKEQVIISKWPRFQPDSAYVSILPKFPKKSPLFFTLVKFGWSQSPVFVQFIITLLLMNILIWNLLCTLL